MRLLSDLLLGVVVCVYCWIGWAVSLFVFVVGLVIRCGCLCLLSDWLFGVVVCVYCWIGWAVWLFALAVGLVGWCYCLRLLSDWLGGVIVCACCRIGWVVVLLAFVVGFIGWCGCLRLLSDLLGGAGVSAFRHDTPAKPRVARVPKARTEPWVNTYTKKEELRRSGTFGASICHGQISFFDCKCHSVRDF